MDIHKEYLSLVPATIIFIQCMNPADCPDKQYHLRVGNEIHHCKGGLDGCECPACLNAIVFGKGVEKINGEWTAVEEES